MGESALKIARLHADIPKISWVNILQQEADCCGRNGTVDEIEAKRFASQFTISNLDKTINPKAIRNKLQAMVRSHGLTAKRLHKLGKKAKDSAVQESYNKQSNQEYYLVMIYQKALNAFNADRRSGRVKKIHIDDFIHTLSKTYTHIPTYHEHLKKHDSVY